MRTSLKKNRDKLASPNRIFHHITGVSPGSTLVFFAGIHGNEFAGVEALNNALKSITPDQIKGEVYGVYGNIKALKERKRFIQSDLNRMWTADQLDTLKNSSKLKDEQIEQDELFYFINELLLKTSGPIYFIDLHTTSSQTLPFITINDAMINRKFSKCFPVPIVLGIEEYLEGPLLSYLNKQGYVAMGFEAGQHDDPRAIKNCEAFIHLALNCSGVLKQPVHNTITVYEKHLEEASKTVASMFEVIHKHHIEPTDQFEMLEGFISFQDVKKTDHLANSNNIPIYAEHDAKLFMPLYQKSGNDGFFIIRPIPNVFLKISAVLRKANADSLLTWLPGITWHNKKQGILKANLRITRFMAKSVFHLFGYRNKQIDDTHMLLYNRERVSRTEMYQKEPWY